MTSRWEDLLQPFPAVGQVLRDRADRENWKWGIGIIFGENELGGFGSSLGFDKKTFEAVSDITGAIPSGSLGSGVGSSQHWCHHS